MPVLALCLLCTLAAAVQPALAAPLGGPEAALQEAVTVLFHGVLQLSQQLNSAYRSTEANLMGARRTMDSKGQTLGLLGMEVIQGQDAAQELHTSLLEMQTEEKALELQAEATTELLGEVAQAQQVLWDSVHRLEAQLKGAWLGHTRHEFEALKAHADKQSHLVWALSGHVHRQRQEMAELQRWLRQIQERLHTAALPA